jgi:hypothetical protein
MEKMVRSLTLTAVLLLLVVAPLAYAADLNLLLNIIKAQHTGDATTYASAVSTSSTTGTQNSAIGAVGIMTAPSDSTNKQPMRPDVSVRAGGFGEVLLAVTVQSLVDRQILPQIDSSIPSRLLPAGIAFIHPRFLAKPMTLRQLLTHTTGLQDTVRFSQSPFQQNAGSGNAVSDLRSACEDYFLTATSSGRQLATDIWVLDKEPGLTKSYLYAKSNIALLGYIVQMIIGERATLVSGPKTVGGLIQEFILTPLGMTNTFFLLPDGSVPRVSVGLTQMTGKRVVELNSAGGVTTTQPIHAVYVADAMCFTSATDVNKLLNALFVDSTSSYFSIGTSLLAGSITVTDSLRPGVKKVGLGGIVTFDATAICTKWTAASRTSQCALSANRPVYGVTTTGSTSAVLGICTDAPTVTGTTAATSIKACTAAVQAYNVQTSRPNTNLFVAAAGAMDQLFIDRTLSEGATITNDSQRRTDFFGFLVFVGVLIVVFVVLMAAYFVEYIVQPAPIAGSVTADAYRRPPKDY